MASDAVARLLALHGQVAVPLAWLVVASFLAGSVAEIRSRRVARGLLVGAWGLFAVFWAVQAPHFAFEQRSIIEGVGAVVAVPASAYVGYLLWHGRDSLFVLSRAVAAMGLVFMPFQAVPFLREWLVETVAGQVAMVIDALGFDPALLTWSEAAERTADAFGWSDQQRRGYAARYDDYRNTFLFVHDGHPITYTVLVACTGIGSMAIFAGLIAAVRAPLSRKLRALAVSLPVIYALNVVRNVFIAVAFGKQYAQVLVPQVMALFGTGNPRMVSYYVADRIVAQSLSVAALVGITYLVVRELPEVVVVVEDLLFVATGNEYDLRELLDLPGDAPGGEPDPDAAVRADGGD